MKNKSTEWSSLFGRNKTKFYVYPVNGRFNDFRAITTTAKSESNNSSHDAVFILPGVINIFNFFMYFR